MYSIYLFSLLLLFNGLNTTSFANETSALTGSKKPTVSQEEAPVQVIKVSIKGRQLNLYEDGLLVRSFSVSIGQDNIMLDASSVASEARSTTYQVLPGDTYWKIAKKHRINVFILKSFNIRQGNLLRAGSTLIIPRSRLNITPLGIFYITNKIENPRYFHDGKDIGPYRYDNKNPFGLRWLGLSHSEYGIHGTNEPETIGEYSTKGCIRLRNEDVVELFDLVAVGTPVEIYNNQIPRESK